MRPNRIISRHRSWLLPLAASIVAWAGTVIVAATQDKRDYSVTAGAITLALLCLMIVGLVRSARNARRTWRHWRWLRHEERVERRREADVAEAWEKAHVLAAALTAGRQLSPLGVWDLALQQGETAHVDLPLGCMLTAPAGPVRLGDRVVCTTQRICVQSYDRWRVYAYKEIEGVHVAKPDLTFVLHFATGVRLVLTGLGTPVVAAYVTWTLASRPVDAQG